MTAITRRSMLLSTAVGVAAATMTPRRAHAAEFNLKIASDVPAQHPLNVRALEAAARIKDESGGRVEITLFPNNQLGGGPDMLSQLRSGALEMFMYSTQLVAPLVPVAALPGIGFAFKDTEVALAAMDGDVGTFIRKQMERANITAMPKIWTSGYRQITSSKGPIKDPKDLDGFKIRVPSSPMWVSLFSGFGAAPTAINFAELYTSLQTKVIDGQENPLVVIDTNHLYEVQKYCSLTNHMWDGYWILANRRALGRLPENLQALIAKHFDQSALDQRADMARNSTHLREELASKGLVFNDVDVAPFRQKLQAAGYFAEWKGKFGADAWATLEKYTGPLA